MKKVISLALTLALLLSMLPVVALGADDFQLQLRPDTLELRSDTAGYPQIDVVCNYSGTLYVESYDSVADAWSDINTSDFSNSLYYKDAVATNTMTTLAITTTTDGSFTDVPADAWYEADVAAAVEAGVISGKGNGEFDPDGTVTQAEAVKLAAVLHSQLSGANVAFDQSEGDNWYNTYWTYFNTIYNSPALSDSLMEKSTSRLYFAWILSTVLDTFSEEELNMNQVDDYAIPDVTLDFEEAYELYRAGIMVGSDSAGTFNAYSDVLRSEMAAIVNRFLDEDARKTVTLTYEDPTTTVPEDGDLTGYVPSYYWYPTYIGEGSEGYGRNIWVTGKYVRIDGKAVLYIDSSDSPDYFSYEAYAMTTDGKLAWSPSANSYGTTMANTDGEYWAPASAWDESNNLSFNALKDGTLNIYDSNYSSTYASLAGTYELVATVVAGS